MRQVSWVGSDARVSYRGRLRNRRSSITSQRGFCLGVPGFAGGFAPCEMILSKSDISAITTLVHEQTGMRRPPNVFGAAERNGRIALAV